MQFKVDPKVGTAAKDTKGAAVLGAGMNYDVGERTAFFVEARYLNVFTSGTDVAVIPLTAGLRYMLR